MYVDKSYSMTLCKLIWQLDLYVTCNIDAKHKVIIRYTCFCKYNCDISKKLFKVSDPLTSNFSIRETTKCFVIIIHITSSIGLVPSFAGLKLYVKPLNSIKLSKKPIQSLNMHAAKTVRQHIIKG